MAAKQGPNVLFCMPNRTKCILVVSAMQHWSRDVIGCAMQGVPGDRGFCAWAFRTQGILPVVEHGHFTRKAFCQLWWVWRV
jgi:hypothetical protein